MTRCIVCGRPPKEHCNEATHAAHDRMWAADVMLLGPQPGSADCCDSCRIVARAVARLADAIGYEETAAELRELGEGFGDPGGEVREVDLGGVPG